MEEVKNKVSSGDKSQSQVAIINQEINRELLDPKAAKALLLTTFKGLSELSMKQAIMEGMLRGFKFKDFLEKNVYAIPFGSGYSLVTSIDNSRKIGMRSGVIGKSAPVYEMDASDIISCSITIKRKVGDDIGEYTATVFFNEYTTKKNIWASKPRTMIAKVAEMHALRMACPEELAHDYIEEEFAKEPPKTINAQVRELETPRTTPKKSNKIKTNAKDKTKKDENSGISEKELEGASPFAPEVANNSKRD